MKMRNLVQLVAILLLACGVLGLVSCGSSSSIPTATALTKVASDGPAAGVERQVLSGINQFRQSQSKPAFQRSDSLDRLARHHAQEMLRVGKMSHDGFHLRTGAAEAYYGIGALRENIYWSKGYSGSQLSESVVTGWINSPKHRRNLLAPNVVCGIGVAVGKDGEVYAAQLSGIPLSSTRGF